MKKTILIALFALVAIASSAAVPDSIRRNLEDFDSVVYIAEHDYAPFKFKVTDANCKEYEAFKKSLVKDIKKQRRTWQYWGKYGWNSMQFDEDNYPAPKALTVKSLDGTQSDQWLEDFGSFSGHFMINSIKDVKYSQTLWMEYAMGEYLAREITTSPIYAHDSGWIDGAFEASVMPYTVCTYYDNGRLTIEDVQWRYEHRDYICFYRDGDNIYKLYSWELEPHADLGNSALRRDIITLNGLTTPSCGKYTIYWDDNEYIAGIRNISTSSQTEDRAYDLQGRRLWFQPTKGIYIKNGVKVYAK